ncbi:hypothetical protein N9R79_02030 [Vibrio sp.]|nr:hypothetical protein [Vibrio sp.]
MKHTRTLLSGIILAIASFGASAALTQDSTWDEIRQSNTISLSNHTIKVGSLRTNVFNVTHQNGQLMTTFESGDYQLINHNGRQGSDSYAFERIGQSQKVGAIDVTKNKYQLNGEGMDVDLQKVGEFVYSQPLTRNIDVYNVQRNSQGDYVKTYLFTKEYTIKDSMDVALNN